MKNKIKTAIGIMMMIIMMVISDKIYVFSVYMVAAVLHECGHLLAARLFKMKIQQIYFDFSGVRIMVDNSLATYKSEIILALAGPIANIISAIIMSFLLMPAGSLEEITINIQEFLATGELIPLGVGGFFIVASCIQALINMIPIKSFDGGRILYCLISLVADEDLAGRIVSFVASVCVFVIWTVSLYLMLKISSGLGIFVFSASVSVLMLKDSDLLENKE